MLIPLNRSVMAWVKGERRRRSLQGGQRQAGLQESGLVEYWSVGSAGDGQQVLQCDRNITKSRIKLNWLVYHGNWVSGTSETGNMDQFQPVKHGKPSQKGPETQDPNLELHRAIQHPILSSSPTLPLSKHLQHILYRMALGALINFLGYNLAGSFGINSSLWYVFLGTIRSMESIIFTIQIALISYLEHFFPQWVFQGRFKFWFLWAFEMLGILPKIGCLLHNVGLGVFSLAQGGFGSLLVMSYPIHSHNHQLLTK